MKQYLLARGSEFSTWAALAAGVCMVTGIELTETQITGVALIGVSLCGGAGAVVALLPDEILHMPMSRALSTKTSRTVESVENAAGDTQEVDDAEDLATIVRRHQQ